MKIIVGLGNPEKRYDNTDLKVEFSILDDPASPYPDAKSLVVWFELEHTVTYSLTNN